MVSVDFMDGMDAADYAMAVAESWGGIGDESLNNGFLLVYAVERTRCGPWRAPASRTPPGLKIEGWLEADFYGGYDAGEYDSATRAFFDDVYGWYESYYGTSAGTVVPSEPGRDFVYYPEPENDYVFAVVGQMGLFLLILLVVVVVCAADGWRYRRYRRRYLLPGMPPPPYVYRPFIFGRPRPPRPPGAPSAHGRRLPPGWGLSRRRGGPLRRRLLPRRRVPQRRQLPWRRVPRRRSRRPLMQHTRRPRSKAPGLRHPFGICVLYYHGKGGTAVETHILVAEDEERLRTIIRDYFTAHGLTCALAKDGEEALERLRERDYDAVLLDVLMPNLDGFAVCRAVREGSGVPILFLTALGREGCTPGYALGADDYVTKPFSLAVLLAKTEALIRRSRGGGAETLACGAITLEPGRRACTVGGRPVALPPREYELLLCLMRNKGQVLRREQLLDKVWGIDFEGGDRAVDGRIKVLRAALVPAGKQIRTVFKVGYKLEEGAHG